ncbi:hypothetical protein [Arenicella xantha]|nr:hypothetical protein [Arenicella xantha]
MQEKKSELKSAKQERVVLDIMSKLSETHPSFYYLSTIEIAVEIEKYIQASGQLSAEQSKLLAGLDRHGIQMMLSLHSN